MTAVADRTRFRHARSHVGVLAAIAAAFALFYAWDVVEAVSNLAGLLAFAGAAGHPLNSYAWLVLGTGILVSPAAYTTAVAVGWSRGPSVLGAVLLVGLATSACLSLSLESLLRA